MTTENTGPTPARTLARALGVLKLFRKSVAISRSKTTWRLDIHALQIFLIPQRLRGRRFFQVSPLAEMGDRWHDLGRCLPFLQVEPGGLVGKIAYAGQPLFEYTANLFWQRATYGLWLDEQFQPLLSVGGPGPWVALHTISERYYWGAELRFDADDRADDAPVFYRTAAEKQARTARFWQQVDDAAMRIRGLAWRGMVEQIRGRRLWPALAAARMVAGATWWLNRHWLPRRGRHGAAIRRMDMLLHRHLVAPERSGNASAPQGEGARCASPV